MENIFIEVMPPWVETGLQPAFYDKESGTVLQQTARMYAKVNDLIKNNNTLAKEFSDLYKYVHDYFDNLDVQEEINNKLDDMAEQGQLADIIAQYLQLAGVIAFNTVAEMQAGENLVNGSTVRTLGKDNYLDGGGRFYKIRNITNDDVVDGVNIIQITADPTDTLIAELIPDDTISGLASLTSEVNAIKDHVQSEMVVIGDSYSSRSYLATPNKLWCEIVAEALNLNLHNYADPGAGFLADGDERQSTFTSQINEAYNDSTFLNDKVAYVFIYGGVNDLLYYPTSNNKSVYTNAYSGTMSNARTKFPNAKIIYLGCDTGTSFRSKAMDDGENITELWIDNKIKDSYGFRTGTISCIDLTMFYIGMSDLFTGGVSGHPASSGHIQFADAVMRGLTSSSNAFTHLVNATPEIDASSSSVWSVANTLAGMNDYQIRITDKTVNLYLSTYISRNASSGNVLIKTPFGLRFPYTTLKLNPYVSSNHFANVICFAGGHTTGNITGMSSNLVELRYGYDNIRMYDNLASSTDTGYDLIFETGFNL